MKENCFIFETRACTKKHKCNNLEKEIATCSVFQYRLKRLVPAVDFPLDDSPMLPEGATMIGTFQITEALRKILNQEKQ